MAATNVVPFSTYLPPDVKEALEKRAARNGRSAAAEARHIIANELGLELRRVPRRSRLQS